MGKRIKIYTSGFLISLMGSLPLGTLNVTAFQIAAFQSIYDALLFVLAVILVELVVVRITLTGANKIDLGNKLFVYVLPIAVAVLMYLSVSSFISANSPEELGKGENLFPMVKSSFLLGLLLSTLNPMHIPFWISWNSVLAERKTLDESPGMYSSYMAGIGIGSFLGLLLFVFAGKYIFQNYHQYSYVIAFIMGCLYLGFSFYLLYVLYKNHLKLNIQ